MSWMDVFSSKLQASEEQEEMFSMAEGGGENAGLRRQEEIDYRDTNVANIGSDADKAARKAAALTDPMWEGAGVEPGIQIWRVENKERDFGVNRWPVDKYGHFHEGDSYIVLFTFQKPDSDKLYWHIHFWLGTETTQDEYGTAAYKTVELDDLLNTEPIQFREVQGHESQTFLELFDPPGMRILAGGIDSGFVHVEEEEVVPHLFEVRHAKKSTRVRELPLSRDSLNHDDCFVLDAGNKIYMFEGDHANAFEKNKAAQLIQQIRAERNGRASRSDIDGQFWEILGGRGDVADHANPDDDDSNLQVDFHVYRVLNDAEDEHALEEVQPAANGGYAHADLTTNDVFIVDTGTEVFVWIGRGAPRAARKMAILRGAQYLEHHNRPVYLPVSAILEGEESEYFWTAFDTRGQSTCFTTGSSNRATSGRPTTTSTRSTPSAAGGSATPAAEAEAEEPNDDADDGNLEVPVGVAGTVQVTVIRGNGITDGGKSADPYCKVKYRGSSSKTEVVKKSVDPEWGSEHHFNLKRNGDQTLTLEAYDKNRLRDDFLGLVTIDLAPLINDCGAMGSTGGVIEDTFPLRAKKEGDAAPEGTVTVRVAISMLKVHVVEARGLEAIGRGKTSSPYAVVKYDGIKCKTGVVKKSISPSWAAEEAMDFAVGWGTHFVSVELFHKGTVGSTFLGQTQIRISDFVGPADGAPPEPEGVWYPLAPREAGKGVRGEVCVAVQVLNPPEALRHVVVEDVPVAGSSGGEIAAGGGALLAGPDDVSQLIVDVVSATALSEDRSTDAFVTLKYGKSKASTAVVDDNVNPEWGEQHLFTLKEQDDQTLLVTVWDKNTMRNKCLGVAEIDLAALANFEPVDEVYPLRAAEAPEPAAPAADGGADGGDGEEETPVVTNPEAPLTGGSVRLRLMLSKLIVKVGAARGLAAKDSRTKSSDPYATVVYSNQKRKTEALKKTLTPTWNESSFAFTYDLATRFFTVDVWDKDIGTDDFLGRVTMSIDPSLAEPTEAWYRLNPRKPDEHVSGEVKIFVHALGLPEAFALGATPAASTSTA